MPLCTVLLSAATLMSPVAQPDRSDLTRPTWCYATEAGQNVESWAFQPDGSAVVTEHLRGGSAHPRIHRGVRWELKKGWLILRVPKRPEQRIKIEKFEGRRVIFKNQTQAVPCRP